MAATRRYLGARTAFGVIIHIEDRLYNAAVTVEARDGSTNEYHLPFLIGHELTLPQPDGPGFTPGERGISAYRSEIARINREVRKNFSSTRKRTAMPHFLARKTETHHYLIEADTEEDAQHEA